MAPFIAASTPKQKRPRRADPGEEREGDERGATDYDRDGRGEGVLAKRHARLLVQKRVVECVEERARRRRAKRRASPSPGKRRTSRISFVWERMSPGSVPNHATALHAHGTSLTR